MRDSTETMIERHNRKWYRRSVQSFKGGFSILRLVPKPSALERTMPLKRLSDGEFNSLLKAGFRVHSRTLKSHVII